MRRVVAAVLGGLLAAGCTSGGSDSSAPPPTQAPTSSTPPSSANPAVAVLGNPNLFRKGIGWGTVRPSRLTMGETGGRYYLIHARLGELDNVQWTDWGGAEAHATALRAAWRPGGGYYKAPVRVEVRVWDLGDCARWGQTEAAYTRMAIRVAPKPGAPVSGKWRDWPLYNLKSRGNLCRPPFQPKPYLKPAKNSLDVYFRGDDWNWRTDKFCVGSGVHEQVPPFGLQGSVQYGVSDAGDVRLTWRNYYARGGGPVPSGTGVPLRVVVADPFGKIAAATIALTRDGMTTATYPQDFFHGRYHDVSLGHRPLARGTYTVLLTSITGTQYFCSGFIVRQP